MSAAPIEFPTVAELESRRDSLIQQTGLTLDQLLDAEFTRSLSMEQYLILDEIRGIEFLLED